MIFKRSVGLVALAGCLALAAGCSSGSSAQAHPTTTIFGEPGFDSELARAALVECALHRGLITTSIMENPQLTYPPRNWSKWYIDGRVIYNIDFANWWGGNLDLVVAGNTLTSWALLAAKQHKLPSQVCSNSAMPSPSPTPLPSMVTLVHLRDEHGTAGSRVSVPGDGDEAVVPLTEPHAVMPDAAFPPHNAIPSLLVLGYI